MTSDKKTLYLANPYGFSSQQREGPLAALVAALEAMGVQVWEPFARNNQIDRAGPGWAYRIGQADLHDVRRRFPTMRCASRLNDATVSRDCVSYGHLWQSKRRRLDAAWTWLEMRKEP